MASPTCLPPNRKSPQGYQHGEDRLFPTINQLITAYQGVLSFPWTDDYDVLQEIAREAQELVLRPLSSVNCMTNAGRLFKLAFLLEGVENTADTEDTNEKEEEELPSQEALPPRRLTKLEKLVGGSSLQDRVFGTDLVQYMQQHPKYPIPLVAEQTILYLNQHGTLGRPCTQISF